MKDRESILHTTQQMLIMILEEFEVAGEFNQSIRVAQIYQMKYPGDDKMEELYHQCLNKCLNIAEEEGADMDESSKACTLSAKIRRSSELAFDLTDERLLHLRPQRKHQTL